MNFVDRYALAVTAANRNIYLQQAAASAAMFKQHGALSVVECWGRRCALAQAHSLPDGSAVQCSAVPRKADQTVVFLSISRPHALRATLV